MASVPDTTNFSEQNVQAVLGGSGLVAMFAAAVDMSFDINYKGSKNALYCFRNYNSVPRSISASPSSISCLHTVGYSGTITVTASSSTTWTASAGSYTSWIHITGGGPWTGNHTFSVVVDTYTSARSGSIALIGSAPTLTIPVTET